MFRLKAYCLILLVGLLAPACTGYELHPATPAATEETPTQAATPVPTEMPTTTPVPTMTSTPAGAWISLSPASGKPGDTVQVDGYVPNPPSETDLKNSNYQSYANFCWSGCQSGLMEEGLQMD